MTRQRAQQAAALFLADLVAIASGFLFAYWLRFVAQVVAVRDLPGDVPGPTAYLPVLGAALFVLPLVMASARLYRIRRTNARVESYIHAASAVTLGMVLVAALVSLYRPTELIPVFTGPDGEQTFVQVLRFSVSRWFLVFFWLSTTFLAVGNRVLIQTYLDRVRRSGRNLKRVVIAGTGELAHTVIDKIRLHEEFGFEIVGMLCAGRDKGGSYRGVGIVGSLEDAPRIVRERDIDQIYVALPLDSHDQILMLLRSISQEMVEIKVVPDLLQYITLRAGVEDLDGVPIVNLSRVPMEGFPAMLKRGFDIAVAGGCLLLFAPLFPIIAAAVKLTSRGPVFYRQSRMGLDGRSFDILKFRSMVVDAEQNTGPVWADEHDTRCTPIGAVLRKLSLDELPQFWNILRGDMSLVGPRPERPHFVDEFREHIPKYMLRHRVRAGLTGWAQVHGWRGNTSLEKRIEYDLYYIENWSLALDLKILWMTVTNGMVHEHAY
jgi:Undecaprenyl-phosphate glucose phosphotransferase